MAAIPAWPNWSSRSLPGSSSPVSLGLCHRVREKRGPMIVSASHPDSKDSPMCNRTSEVWSFGPSRNDEVASRVAARNDDDPLLDGSRRWFGTNPKIKVISRNPWVTEALLDKFKLNQGDHELASSGWGRATRAVCAANHGLNAQRRGLDENALCNPATDNLPFFRV